ncbi:MAG: hypothetical protein K2X01_03455 [Cyanobacteria bacterium]|nr:hypothetical protein [Cyanobacteriota bacterium]
MIPSLSRASHFHPKMMTAPHHFKHPPQPHFGSSHHVPSVVMVTDQDLSDAEKEVIALLKQAGINPVVGFGTTPKPNPVGILVPIGSQRQAKTILTQDARFSPVDPSDPTFSVYRRFAPNAEAVEYNKPGSPFPIRIIIE